MADTLLNQIRKDCLVAADALPALENLLHGQHIAVVGGLGFAGTWLAEMLSALNDERGVSVRLTLIGRDLQKWRQAYPHLVRNDIFLQSADICSPFEFAHDTTLVIHAAGVADPRVQASEPQRIYYSNLFGIDNSLTAANRLESLQRFVNVSSGLVVGTVDTTQPLTEADVGLLDFKRLHNLYAETRRAAEAIAGSYASQYRLPISTVRPFTFLGPFQPLDAPWALNNFIRDALFGHEIRIYGAGSSRRSYLYGSDVAAWLLQAALVGKDGAVYNFGGDQAVSHEMVAQWVSELTKPQPRILAKTRSGEDLRSHDFIPDVSHTNRALGVSVTVDVRKAIHRTMQWQAYLGGTTRRLREDMSAHALG